MSRISSFTSISSSFTSLPPNTFVIVRKKEFILTDGIKEMKLGSFKELNTYYNTNTNILISKENNTSIKKVKKPYFFNSQLLNLTCSELRKWNNLFTNSNKTESSSKHYDYTIPQENSPVTGDFLIVNNEIYLEEELINYVSNYISKEQEDKNREFVIEHDSQKRLYINGKLVSKLSNNRKEDNNSSLFSTSMETFLSFCVLIGVSSFYAFKKSKKFLKR